MLLLSGPPQVRATFLPKVANTTVALLVCMRCVFWLVQGALVQAMTSSTAPQFDAGTYREGLRVSPAFQRNKQPILEAPHRKCCIVRRFTDASQKLQRHAYTLPRSCIDAAYPTASSLRIHCTGAAATPAQATAGRHRAAPSARGRLRPGRAPMSTTSPMWPAGAAQAADWPRPAEASGSLRHGLALK